MYLLYGEDLPYVNTEPKGVCILLNAIGKVIFSRYTILRRALGMNEGL